MNIWDIVIVSLIKIAIVLGILLFVVTYLVYFERKISAWVQNRRGPNRTGWYGLMQTVADVLKLILKEDIVPDNAIKPIHTLAPFIAVFVAFTTWAVIPLGPPVTILGYKVDLFLVDVNIGVLYVLALTSLSVYGLALAGWSSGSKYSILGGIRSSAQMISYEVSMGFSVAGVILLSESLRPIAIIQSQSGWMWNALIQPIGFITFVVSAFAETNRLPFDLPEAEPELVGGYHTEYSSTKFAGFFLAEYANMIVASAMISLLYLGGWQVPFLQNAGLSESLTAAIQVAAFLIKILFVLFFFIWIRWSIPRFRYDQLMSIGWKVMFPLSLLNLLWVAIVVMVFRS